MSTLLKICIVSVILSLITACASKPTYREAQGSGFGYSEQANAEDQFTVNFKMRGDNKEEAVDFALQRAAELTLKSGNDWFVVQSKSTEVEREKRTTPALNRRPYISRTCGVFGCATTTSYPITVVGVGERQVSEEVDAKISIRMGKGKTPSEQDAYDAKTIQQLKSQREQK